MNDDEARSIKLLSQVYPRGADEGDDFEMETMLANVDALTDVIITALGLELRSGGR